MFHKIVLIALAFFFVSCNNPNEEQIIDGKTVSNKLIIDENSGLLQTQHMTTAHTIALHLETTQIHKNDTRQIGSDTYTVYVDYEHSREYCLENDLDEGHRYTIQDKQSNKLLDISHGCSTINLDKGVYTHTLYNGTVNEGKSHAVFIHPDVTNTIPDLTSMTPNISQKSSKIRVYNAVQENILVKKTVISFNTCQGCNLESLDLSNQAFDKQFQSNNLSPKMNDDYFTSLNTFESDFFSSQNTKNIDAYNGSPLNIEEASLRSSNLSYSVFRNANFNGVDFTDANLSHAVFIDSSFQGATFDHTDMTRAVFINPDYKKEFNSKTVIVSKPSITTLFYGETNHYYGDAFAAIDNNNRLVLFHLDHSGEYAPLPNGLKIVSPPSIVVNNFYTGFSVFVKANDGYIYEYFTKGNADLKDYDSSTRNDWYNNNTKKWHKMVVTNPNIDFSTNICQSNPKAAFDNFGSGKEVKTILVCHDYNGKLHEWTRYFYNKPHSASYSSYGEWIHNSYSMPKTNAEISINGSGMLAYIGADKNITYYTYANYPSKVSKVRYNPISNVELSKESNDVYNAGFVQENGNVYVGDIIKDYYNNGNSELFHNIGHPLQGVISSPALGGKSSALQVVVLSGDGKLYKKRADGSTDWNSATTSGGTFSSSFKFTNNNLTETYIDNADLSSLDLSSNTLTKTFFTNVNLSHTIFDDTTLTDVIFDASRYFDNVSFQSATLNNVSFTNHTDDTGDNNTDHKNIISVDFTGSTINGFTWTNNIAANAIFDDVNFTKDGTITSHENKFIGNQPVASFRKAINVPVELVMQETTQNVKNQKADPLRSYDFSSAGFRDSFYTLDFTDTNMSGARFGSDDSSPPVDFKSIDATGSLWKDANLSYVTCDGCIFHNTMLNHTSLYYAQMNYSDFNDSKWSDTNASFITVQYGTFSDANLSGSYFNNATFINSQMPSLYAAGIKATNARFNNTVLNGANFSNAVLTSSNFTDTVLDPLPSGFFSSKDTTFSGATLQGAIMKVTAVCANFSGASIRNANFSSANLSGAKLSSLTGTDTNEKPIDFSSSILKGVNFTGTGFNYATFSDAKFDFNSGFVYYTYNDERKKCSYKTTDKPTTGDRTICSDKSIHTNGCW